MRDRDILEKAAKAIGLVGEVDDEVYLHREDTTPIAVFFPEDGSADSWAPLTDDGDALRLAVRLGMSMALYTNPDETWCSIGIRPGCREPHGEDIYAATRRAIVRTAAEFGESMP